MSDENANIEQTQDKQSRMLELEKAFYEDREVNTMPQAPGETASALPQQQEDSEVPEKAESVESTEPAAEEVGDKKPQEDEFSSRFAQLTKMENQLREREQLIKENEAERKELQQLRELKDLAKKDPQAAAEALGLSFNDWAEQTIDNEQFTEKKKSQQMAERLQRLEEAAQNEKKEKEEREKQEAAQKYVNSINSKIDEAGDKYPLVRSLNGGRQLVINTISEWFRRTGEEMPWEKAAQMSEDYLFDQKLKEFEVLNKVDKFKSKLNIPTKSEPEPEPKSEPKKEPNAITNMIASAPATKEVGKVTREERRRRIRELANGLFSE